MKGWALALGLVCLPSLVIGQEDASTRLLGAKSLKCSFTLGAVGNWDEKGPKFEQDTKGLGTLHFDGIERKQRRARLIGNQGAGDVALIAGPDALSFVETTPIGNLIVTTVFAAYQPNTESFLAVTSRHVGMGMIGGGAIPSQYYGTCLLWEQAASHSGSCLGAQLQPNKRMQLTGASDLRNVRQCPSGQGAAADARSVRPREGERLTAALLEAEFATRRVPYGGNLLLLNATDATALVRRAAEMKVPVLGVNCLRLAEGRTEEPLEHIADYSQPGREDTWGAAVKHIAERSRSGFVFEIVLGD